jgi:hypothetical protein
MSRLCLPFCLSHRGLRNASEQDGDTAVQWLFGRDDEGEAFDHEEQNNGVYMRNCPSCIRSAYYYIYPHTL